MTPELTVVAAVAFTGVASAALYARKRQWTSAALSLVAATSLAGLLTAHGPSAISAAAVTLATEPAAVRATSPALEAALLAAPRAEALVIEGHGLTEAQWRDLPPVPVQWREPAADLLRLDFPRTVALGRTFALTVRRTQPSSGWRLQLLAENGQVLADAGAAQAASAVTVQWQPPIAETMVLQARLLDSKGGVIAQGPIPLRVEEAIPLQLQARFGAPSFDARVLNQLLSDSNAVVDWQTTLGKAVARTEAARETIKEPNAILADAAFVESNAARAALLAQVAQGTPLLVFGGDAADSALWQRELGLRLQAVSPTTEKEDVRHFALAGTTLALPPAALLPAQGSWQALASDKDGKPWLWQREWHKGRIIWLGLADWHKYAITAPAALGQWWQQVLDYATAGSTQKMAWRLDDPMPLPGVRTEICAQGLASGAPLQLADGAPAALQSRADKADAACAAFWPAKPGWQQLRSGDAASQMYVFGAADWPAWQKALRHDATERYMARSAPAAVAKRAEPALPAAALPWERLPAWPFGIAFVAAMLGLWWRERR